MKRWGTLGLVVAFLILALFVYLEPRITARPTPTPAGASRNLLEVSSAAIQRIRVIDHAAGREAEVERDASGQWFMIAPTRHLVRQDALDTLAGGLATLFVQQVISDVTDLSAYGLVTPTYTIGISATGSGVHADGGDGDADRGWLLRAPGGGSGGCSGGDLRHR
jgi:hypothetical protein